MTKQERQEQTGAQLRALRRGRPLREVAPQIGISPSALHMYESGRRTPRDEAKMKLARYYGVSITDLFFSPD